MPQGIPPRKSLAPTTQEKNPERLVVPAVNAQDGIELRCAAEAQLAENQAARTANMDAATLPHLVHELQVHQIELEMQNEELRRTQHALEQSRDQYVDLYDFAPIGYVTLTVNGRIARINLTSATLLGVERANLLQKPFAEFVVRTDQDRYHLYFMRGIKNAGNSTIELELRRGGGSVFFAQLDCVRENLSNNSDPALRSRSDDPCLRIALSDISVRKALERELLRSKEDLEALVAERTEELRASQEKFRSAIANAAIGFAMLSPGGNFMEVNAAFCKITGYSDEELISMAFPQLIHPGDVEANLHQFNALLAGRITDYVLENRFCHKRGHPVWVRKSVSLVRDRQGRPQMAVILVENITGRHLAEDAMTAALVETQNANKAKSVFLAAASHDLRQPLSALSIYAGLLDKMRTSPDRKIVANMKDCIRSLSDLLNKLLNLSKLQAGVITPHVTDFSVAGMLANLESVHVPDAEARGLRLRYIPSNVLGRTDTVLFQRLVSNLIENGLRFTKSGGVLVGCRRRHGKTWIEVWDTGIGIPANRTEEIFEEFKKLGDDARTSGSGLGLAIVAKTAALLGLEISVRSRPGRGSVFAIELPLGKAALIPSAEEPLSVVSRPLRIALVEDNPLVFDALVIGLQALGHQVTASATKRGLMDVLEQLSLDIIVSDYRLTDGETGYDVIAAARARLGAKLPAILITGDTDPDVLRSMTDRGIVVLHKPVDLETLRAYIEDLTCQDP